MLNLNEKMKRKRTGFLFMMTILGLQNTGPAWAAAIDEDPISVVAPAPEETASIPLAETEIDQQLRLGNTAWNEHKLIDALKAYDQALTLAPDNVPAREGRLRTLSRLGSPGSALIEAQRYPQISPAVVQNLYEDETALAIRWSESVYYAKPGERYPESDRAIALAQANLLRYPNSERTRFDLVRALNNRQRSADAITAYESLQREQLTIPGYVHEAAGSAYFAEKKPELSAQAYRIALAADPDSLDANLGLFYALSDQNEFVAAKQHIDAFAARSTLPNDKFSATSAAILGRAYESRLDVAQARFLALQEEAPASTDLHVALGRVYLWRGWPRRAKFEIELAAQKDPDDSRANNALVETDTALSDYRAASERLAQLQAASPEDPDGKNLVRAEAVRNLNELSISVSGTRSKENIGSGQGYILETKLYAKPLWFQTRPFIHEYYERGIIDDITADYRRLGIGVEHVFANAGTIEAEMQQEFFLEKKSSLSLTGKFDLSDHWKVNGRLDSNAIDVPLRARYDRISGWEALIGAGYRASEQWGVRAEYSVLHMSDENIRRSAALIGEVQLVQGPFYKGTLELELSASRNTLANTNYFNPESDYTTLLSYTSEWLTYQRYTRSFRQQLVLAAGRYRETGFDAGTIGSITYEHDWQLNDVMSLRYGIGYARRLFNGEVSSGAEANLSFNWRF